MNASPSEYWDAQGRTPLEAGREMDTVLLDWLEATVRERCVDLNPSSEGFANARTFVGFNIRLNGIGFIRYEQGSHNFPTLREALHVARAALSATHAPTEGER